MADALSVHLGYPRVDLARQYIAPEIVELVPDQFLQSHDVLPLAVENSILTVAMTDPLNIFVIDELQRITGMAVNPVIATAEEIKTALSRAQDIASTARKVLMSTLTATMTKTKRNWSRISTLVMHQGCV